MSSQPHIAIVGSGPAGCYTAQGLRKDWPDAEITVIDRLPVPYGLIRYGVAADHQGTKAVTKQFDRLFERGGVTFNGGIEVGVDVDLDDLRAHYDVVVLATGLCVDRRLNIPGEYLTGVYGSGQITRLLNGHPDEHGLKPRLGERVVVIGNGNVAIDLVRLIAKHPDDFAGSDLHPEVHDLIHRPAVQEIVVVGRSGARSAKFDPAMVKELAKLAGVDFAVDAMDEPANPQVAALKHLIEHQIGGDRIRVRFCFGWTPREVMGADGCVRGVVFAAADGRTWHHEADSVLTAIGFAEQTHLGASGEWRSADGRLGDGLYTVGWARRGPQGAIPDARTDARLVAQSITADLRERPCPGSHHPARLRAAWPAVDFAGWQRIDHHERVTADASRVRNKLRTHADLRQVATTHLVTEGERR
ncbi:FAD-dependent oxidoreductase [Nocardioides sp. AN3]